MNICKTGSTRKVDRSGQREQHGTGQIRHSQTELQPQSCWQMTFSLTDTALPADPRDGGIEGPKSCGS